MKCLVGIAGRLTLLTMAAQVTAAPVLFVDARAPDGGDGLDWTTAFNDLQDGLAAARTNTQIWIAAGTYFPDRGTGDRLASFELRTGVQMYGGFMGGESGLDQRDIDANLTILSGDIGIPGDPADNSDRVVVAVDVTGDARLDGLTVRDGVADIFGGGMYIRDSTFTVANCTFTENAAYAGAGLMIINGNPVVHRCRFVDNIAVVRGAGTYNVAAPTRFTQCEYIGNYSYEGGSLYNVGGLIRLDECLFAGNVGELRGAGFVNVGAVPELARCTFRDNMAADGGAFYNDSGLPFILACYFENNVAIGGKGGGFYNRFGFPIIASSIFIGNEAVLGGATYNERGFPIMSHCTAIGNSADGSVAYSEAGIDDIRNSILWGNVGVVLDGASGSTIESSCVEGGWPGEGNISEDPRLDPGDLAPMPDSPCIDSADNELIPDRVAIDFRAERRQVDDPAIIDRLRHPLPAADMGALERQIEPFQLELGEAVAGRDVTVELSGGAANAPTTILASQTGYGRRVLDGPGMIIALEVPDRVIDWIRLDGDGHWSGAVRLPVRERDRLYWIQAVSPAAPSNVVMIRIE